MLRSVVAVTLLAAVSSAYSAGSPVRTLAAGEEAGCEHLLHNECRTTSSKADEFCLAWHQDEARAAGADALMLGESDSSRQNKPSLVGMKTVVTTSIQADYYRCAKPAEQAVAAPAAKASGVEERLQVLESLKAKGLISADEYQQKRKEILADL